MGSWYHTGRKSFIDPTIGLSACCFSSHRTDAQMSAFTLLGVLIQAVNGHYAAKGGNR